MINLSYISNIFLDIKKTLLLSPSNEQFFTNFIKNQQSNVISSKDEQKLLKKIC